MLQKVKTGTRSFLDYSFYRESDDLQAEIEKYQKLYQGIRLYHINSTPYGGGVAALLYCCMPLLGGIGMKTDWRIIEGNQNFFKVTKAFHNALQGAEYAPLLSEKMTRKELYELFQEFLSSKAAAATLGRSTGILGGI